MNFPEELKYTKEHEWIKMISDDEALVGITDFAQSELGDIIFVDITSLDEEVDQDAEFGSIEAVKTVSDLFLPVNGTVLEMNSEIEDSPELVNEDPYGKGWLVKIKVNDKSELDALMDASAYKSEIGQ